MGIRKFDLWLINIGLIRKRKKLFREMDGVIMFRLKIKGI
jgi:hypothetical protein